MKARPIKTVTVVVSAIDEPTPGDVKRFVLTDPDGWTLPPFRPGAHIDVHLANGLVRTYSLCNEPADSGRYVIAVKREAAGRGGSRHLHDELRPGMRLGVSLPRGGVPIHPQALNVFVAGGVGVTPFISVVRDMERRGQTNYRLHWSSAGEPGLADMLGPAIASGRVRLYDTRVAPRPDLKALVRSPGPDTFAACCGPTGMLDAFEQAVADWPDERKHLERFTPPKPVVDPTAKPYSLVLAQSGRSMEVTPELGLVAALEALGAEVSVSCAGGICGACRTRWLEGPPIHRDRVLSPAEREQEVMVCVAGCAGPRLVLDL